MSQQIVWIIFNGPSSTHWHNKTLPGVVYGCNFAYRDFELDAVFAVDRFAVHAITVEKPDCECWTKKSVLKLELNEPWKEQTIPGIDSGSFALEHALINYPNHLKIVIGADGILRLNSQTVYEYKWRGNKQPQLFTHLKHRTTVEELLKKYQQTVKFVSNCQDSKLETISYDHANSIRECNLVLSR
tara:strand:+ start:458 stop:1015 length:558 start_codon:yes stop_codon:yes gene_type:complete